MEYGKLVRRTSKMALSYLDVSRFVRDNGDVKAFAERSQVTLLKNGSIDSVLITTTWARS
jgi:hypothetical protein